MTTLKSNLKTLFVMILAGLTLNGYSQIDNWRSYDKDGINVFEAPKSESTFDGETKVRVGGAFTQQFQALSHDADTATSGAELYDLAPGFNLATANLYIDAQLGEGIRLHLASYMSSRHHTEFWVKGGYIQIDQLPMFDNPDWFTDQFRVKIGHFQPNYGDQQFRRSDNGMAMYNPFVGNYIMDAFATEIGGEVYYWATDEIMLMGGMTNGLIKNDIMTPAEGRKRSPSIYLKAAYDGQVNDDLRVRVSASLVNNANTIRNTMYAGDRTGARFYGALSTDGSDFRTGRWNPGFNNQLMAIQINPFIKFKGLEVFGVIESASGNVFSSENGESVLKDDTKRSVMQTGGEVVYRFLENERAFVGFKYNSVSGQLDKSFTDDNGDFMDASISRMEMGAGWFPIDNLLLKATYVNQTYTDFPDDNLYYEGFFKGFMIEAVAAF